MYLEQPNARSRSRLFPSRFRFEYPDVPNHQIVASNRVCPGQDEARCLKKSSPFALATLSTAGDSKHVEVAHQVAFQLRICMRDERRKDEFNDQQTAILRNLATHVTSQCIGNTETCSGTKHAAAGIRHCHFDEPRIRCDISDAAGHKTTQIQCTRRGRPRPAVSTAIPNPQLEYVPKKYRASWARDYQKPRRRWFRREPHHDGSPAAISPGICPRSTYPDRARCNRSKRICSIRLLPFKSLSNEQRRNRQPL